MVPSVSRVQWKITALGLVAMAAGIVLGHPQPAGVLVGAGLVLTSLWFYALLFDAVLRTGRPHLALGLTFVKLAAFLALGWWAMSRGAGAIDPLGVAAGITCLPLAALWEALEARGN
jgi:hypothetical protein